MNYSITQTDQTMSMGSFAFVLLVSLLQIVGMWKIFVKAGEAGWKSIIPIYNLVIIFKISKLNPWLILLLCIPIANIIISIIYCNKLAKAFGKGIGYTLGLIFFAPIFIILLGFGSAEYVGDVQ